MRPLWAKLKQRRLWPPTIKAFSGDPFVLLIGVWGLDLPVLPPLAALRFKVLPGSTALLPLPGGQGLRNFVALPHAFNFCIDK